MSAVSNRPAWFGGGTGEATAREARPSGLCRVPS